MYLEEIYLENTGPISKCHVKPPFDDNGNPLPIVIVGPNGSGKSIFLSYIVDALTEFAEPVFRDVIPSSGLNRPYFRVIHQRAIRSGQRFSLSLLHFKANNDNLYYREKSGMLNPAAYSPDVKSVFDSVWQWPKDENHKEVLSNEKTIKEEMRKGAYAFFPASRREQPDWLNPKSLKVGMNASINRRSNDELDKPIWVETCAEENISWILDVFLDSLVDLQPQFQKWEGRDFVFREINSSEFQELRNSILLRQGRQNVESILQEILQDETAELILNYRNIGASRISIKMSNGRTIPALQSLSEGLSQLFHLFTTIIRYGERTDLNRSIRLHDITGIVVIDEIDAHLHPTLQHSVVPRLIKLFPKVQFIVSSHSPLFLLGMEKTFNPDGVTILKLPNGDRISSEDYPEFRSAFEYYQATESFEEEIEKRFADGTKPLVLTEGVLDMMYIQTALKLLGQEALLDSLEIQPVGVEGPHGWEYGGKSGLDRVRKFYEKDPLLLDRMLLLLYDWDADKSSKTDEKLWVRSIEKNPDDVDDKEGIEDLFPAHLFEDRFYDDEPKKGVHGRHKVEPKFKKTEFCQWICGERKDPTDFEKFDSVVKILKEFVETYQSHLD